MAIFGTKKKEETKKAGASAKAVKAAASKTAKQAKVDKAVVSGTVSAPATTSSISSSMTDSILRPRITEKSGILSQTGVYTFEVTKNATKNSVSKAVIALYKVTPVKVAIINVPAKQVFIRGRKGTSPGMKKAMVTVKKGEKIDFV